LFRKSLQSQNLDEICVKEQKKTT